MGAHKNNIFIHADSKQSIRLAITDAAVGSDPPCRVGHSWFHKSHCIIICNVSGPQYPSMAALIAFHGQWPR